MWVQMSSSEPVVQTAERTWKGVRLSEIVFLVAMAALILLSKGLFHRHLHVPGHSAFFLLFFLLMAKGGVARTGSATVAATVAGADWLLMGLGSEGPLQVLTYIVPALVVDAFCARFPSAPRSFVLAGLIGALAGFSRVVGLIPGDFAAASDPWTAVHVLAIKSLAGLAFGALGAVLVPSFVRKLDRSRIFPL
jgi:hypothetical protein